MIAGLTAAERVETTIVLLAAAAIDAGYAVSGDMRVSEENAANLIGLSPGYLKMLRKEGNGPISYQVGVNGSRISYRIHDLAAWIDHAREDLFANGR
jgi:hypothetical protein